MFVVGERWGGDGRTVRRTDGWRKASRRDGDGNVDAKSRGRYVSATWCHKLHLPLPVTPLGSHWPLTAQMLSVSVCMHSRTCLLGPSSTFQTCFKVHSHVTSAFTIFFIVAVPLWKTLTWIVTIYPILDIWRKQTLFVNNASEWNWFLMVTYFGSVS